MKSIAEFQPQLEAIMKGIAKQFGANCEVVLHDHSKGLEKSIVAIENGHITGRKVGDPSTNIGFAIERNDGHGDDQYGYISRLNNGKTVRSSSVYLKDDNGRVLGSLCINFDITNLVHAENTIKELACPRTDEEIKENFVSNVGDILDSLIDDYLLSTGLVPEKMNKQDMIGLIGYLDKKGAFLIRNAAMKICRLLNISKYTLYAYIKETGNHQADENN